MSTFLDIDVAITIHRYIYDLRTCRRNEVKAVSAAGTSIATDDRPKTSASRA